MSRPVRPRPLQSDGDPPITQPVQASLPEWWATEILAEPLEPLAVACRHVHGRMEVEAGIVAVERHVAIDGGEERGEVRAHHAVEHASRRRSGQVDGGHAIVRSGPGASQERAVPRRPII